MTEKELRKQLQNVYGDVPPATHAAFQRALSSPERTRGETTVKKRIMAVPVLVVLLVLLVGGAAYAAVSEVMNWYYTNRFDIRERYPEQYETMMNHVITDIPQEQSKDDTIIVRVPEAIWVPEDGTRSISAIAAPINPDEVELHPLWNLDADGSYVGSSYDPDTLEEGSEDRPDHWLWTEKGCGPVLEMMEDPSKQLLLIDFTSFYSLDALDYENGSVLFMLEDTMSQEKLDACRVEGGWEMPLRLAYTLWAYDPETDDVDYYSSGTVTLTLYIQE